MTRPLTCMFEVQAASLGWAKPYQLPLYHQHDNVEVKITAKRLRTPRTSCSHRVKVLKKAWIRIGLLDALDSINGHFKHGDFRH